MASDSNLCPEVCPSGVPGLDMVLCGGFPRNRLYLIEGDSGVGKTTLALQFLLEGVRMNERCLYVTLSETKDELLQVAKSHGWSLDKLNLLELSAIEQQLKSETEHTFFHPSEVELNKTTRILTDEIERIKPSRIVFDSLSEMRLMAETALRYRRQILSLKQFLAGKNATILLLDDNSTNEKDQQVRSLAHGVLSLQKTSPVYGINRRNLIVEKIRGVKFREGFHDTRLREAVSMFIHDWLRRSIILRSNANRYPAASRSSINFSGAVSIVAPARSFWDHPERANRLWQSARPFVRVTGVSR